MKVISESIIDNVGAPIIETYLRKEKIQQNDEEIVLGLKERVDSLIRGKIIDIDKFESFLFDELFYGKRKNIHIYRLDRKHEYKYISKWTEKLREKYNIESCDFVNVLGTHFGEKDEKSYKLSAVKIQENIKGEVVDAKLLFACKTIFYDVNGNQSQGTMYYPVEIDMQRGIMIIKAWNKIGIANDFDKVNVRIEQIRQSVEADFKVSTKAFGVDHKKVLFKMSRKLLRDSYELIPGYKELNKIDSSLDTFVKAVIGSLPLKHKNNLEYDLTIYDIESEIRNIVDGLIISDFFCDIRFDSMWDKELEAVVTRIKFNDKEQVLTSLSGENTETPICYTKTFMTLRERMEETEKIECLWIYLNDKKRKFSVKYDASNGDYLDVLVKYGLKFSSADMERILEMYEKYEKYDSGITDESSVNAG